MREPFNVEAWKRRVLSAIADNDGDTLANVLYENDGNGCFSYKQSCREFGWTNREEWTASLIDCAEEMIARIEEEEQGL